MSVKISSSTISKLEHEIPEIRIRAIKHIEGKMSRALLQNETIIFSPGILVKQLIRWFGRKQVYEEETALNLILIILRSHYIHETIKYLGLERLKCELNKIQEILNSNNNEEISTSSIRNTNKMNCRKIINEIKEILKNYEESPYSNGTRQDDDDYKKIVEEITDRTSLTDNGVIEISSGSEDIINDEFSQDYERPWSTISAPDYNSLKLLCDTFTSKNTDEVNLKHAFKYLQISIYDFPPEYFLQPPYIFKSLLILYSNEKRMLKNLFQNFIFMTKSLLARIKMRKLSKTYDVSNENGPLKSKIQLTITRYCMELFNLCIENIKELTESNDQHQIFLTFQLLFQIIDLIDEDSQSYISCESLLIDLGYITKYYRQIFQIENVKRNRLWRQYYIIFLYIMSKILKYKCHDKYQEVDSVYNLTANRHNQVGSYNTDLNDFKKSAIATRNGISTEIWREELQIALLDYPLKKLYPEIYQSISDFLKLNSSTHFPYELDILLNCDKFLLPAVKLLRQSNELSDKEFIYHGYEVMDTLSIHKSLDFVKKIFESIIRCMPSFEGNSQLKEKSENILLHLFAHENLAIKKFIYKESATRVKQLFAELMNGTSHFGKICGTFTRKSKTFGIPLTVNILNEIICFGYTHFDICISKNADVILCLIIKGKHLAEEYWQNILDILLPNLPLLQYVTTKESTLGSLVLEFLNPNNDIPTIEIIQGNLRYLFNSDSSIRSEALSRLIYILSTDPDSHLYIPNILEISDTLSNDICILNAPRDSEKIFSGGFYEKSTVFALLELLKSPDVDPSVRRTTLMQLNVMCQDTELNDLIHDEKGWYYAIEAVENSLKKDPIIDYPDTVIPAIGILSKITLCNPHFRREISKEKKFYNILLRSLFIFHHDLILQQDCTLLLFLLVFNSYIIGSKNLTIPKQLSKVIKLPIKCDFHWNSSPYNQKSPLENIFLQLTNENAENISSRSSISSSSSSTLNLDLKMNKVKRRTATTTSTINEINLQKPELQYIRLSYASLWFDGFEFILESIKKQKKMINCNDNNNTGNIKKKLNYSLIPGHENIIEIIDSMKFDENLQLIENDIKIIKFTLQNENVRYFIKHIWNATIHNDVIVNLNAIKINLLLASLYHTKEKLNTKNLIDCLRKFIMTSPNLNSEIDLVLFENVINFFKYILEVDINNKNDDKTLLKWILEDLQQKHSIPLIILKNFSYPRTLYYSVCNFLEMLIKKLVQVQDKHFLRKYIIYTELIELSTKTIKTISTSLSNKSTLNKKNSEKCSSTSPAIIQQNLYNRILEYLIPIIEECFDKRLLGRFHSLLNLLKILCSTNDLDIDYGYKNLITKKLLYFIMALKSFTQAGSNYVKTSLLIIGNLMKDVDEFILENQHIRLLSGLCGHPDFEIRGLSWCILGKIAKKLKGAQIIIKELSCLPGGFHACCLSTFLDKTEIPIVRTSAGNCLSNLLIYKSKTIENELDLTVIPLCMEFDSSNNDNISGFELIKQIFRNHQFFIAVNRSLDNFYITDVIINEKLNEITTCSIVITYCSVLINYIDLRPSIVNEIIKEPFFIRIFNLIKRIPSWLTKSSLEMTASICDLSIRIFKTTNSTFLQRNVIHDRSFIVTLIQLLNVNHFAYKSDMGLIVPIMEVLRILSHGNISFEIICEILASNENFKNVFRLLSCGICSEDNQEIQNASLKFMIALLIKSQNKPYRFTTFSQIIDSNIISDFDNSTNLQCNNEKMTTKRNSSKSRSSKELEKRNFLYGSEILFDNIRNLFEKCFPVNKTNGKKIQVSGGSKILVVQAAGALLKTTKKSHDLAKEMNFLEIIIQRLNEIFDVIHMQCTDFIRKYGDNKKTPIIHEFCILYDILLNWFSSDCLQDELQIIDLCKILMQTWPWTSHSNELKLIIFKCLAFLSEDSITVCKKFSITISNYTNTIIQLIANAVVTETKKVKHPSIDFTILKVGLRILANCCSCIEGRLQLIKINLLDIFNLFHPSVTKLQKSWNLITLHWLKFWNIFSRHPEGAIVCHLTLLCNLIVKADETIRIECLTILRNMAFISGNRAALLSSEDYLYIIKYILTKGNTEEQFIISIALWKLIADNYKSKYIIKSTSIPNQLKMISKKLSFSSSSSPRITKIKCTVNNNYDDNGNNNNSQNEEDNIENDLFNVIEILLKILN